MIFKGQRREVVTSVCSVGEPEASGDLFLEEFGGDSDKETRHSQGCQPKPYSS